MESAQVSNQDKPPSAGLSAAAANPGPVRGIAVGTAAVILVGEMAGAGFLALPKAVLNTGWIGLLLVLVGCLAAGVNGVLLGRCWVLLLHRYPDEFQDTHIRNPYPLIGEKALGKWMRYLVSAAMDFTLFGASVVFLLISSENIQSLLSQVGVDLSFCYIMLILQIILIPASWLGTPKDFWPIAVGAAGSTTVACILVFTQILRDIPRYNDVMRTPPSFKTLFLGYGAIVFAFGGASLFPTVQQDMKKPARLGLVVVIAFLVLLAMYLPVSTAGYFIYGDHLENNILQSLPEGGIRITVEIMMTAHLTLAIIIALNPVLQEVENVFSVPHSFHWKRCLVRTGLMCAILFVAETIPRFGPLLDLIGGSSVSFMSFVAPSLFYICLTSQKGPWPDEPMSLHMKVLCGEMMLVGVVGGVASTVSAVSELTAQATFIPPCYVHLPPPQA